MSVDFLDSNVVLYVLDATNSRKRGIAEELVRAGIHDGTACISHQVVQEVLNVVTRKLSPPLETGDARRFLDRVLFPLWSVMPSQELYHRALAIREQYDYQFYDSLIVAAALQAGCGRLLTEDLQDGQRVAGLRIENPFSGV